MLTRPGLVPKILVRTAGWFFLIAMILSAHATDQWVYFGTYTGGTSKGIYVSRLSATGALSEPRLVAAIPNPSFLATDATHRFLYAASEVNAAGKKTGDVVAYAINARTGDLTQLNEQASGGEVLCHIEVDATGKTVLVASYGGGSVSALPVQADGSLGTVSSFLQHHGSSVNPRNQKGPHAHCVVTDPANRFAFACDLGVDQILCYKLDAAAATLTSNTPAFTAVAPGSGPRHLAFSPAGKFAYLINEMGCNVTVFAYDAARGTLAEIQTVSALPADRVPDATLSGAEIAVHPSGKFLYASTRGVDQIHVFAIDEQTGKLSVIEHVASGGKTPRFFGLDASGAWLLAANQNSDNVTIFKINPENGCLTPSGQTLPIGNPSCAVFVPVK